MGHTVEFCVGMLSAMIMYVSTLNYFRNCAKDVQQERTEQYRIDRKEETKRYEIDHPQPKQ